MLEQADVLPLLTSLRARCFFLLNAARKKGAIEKSAIDEMYFYQSIGSDVRIMFSAAGLEYDDIIVMSEQLSVAYSMAREFELSGPATDVKHAMAKLLETDVATASGDDVSEHAGAVFRALRAYFASTQS